VPFQEEGCNLTANSLHPGAIITNIIRYVAGNNSNDIASSDLSKKMLIFQKHCKIRSNKKRFIQEQNHIVGIQLTNINVCLTGALISVLSPVANLVLKSIPQVIES